VTRPADASEDHKSVTGAEFDSALRKDAFAFSWKAHGYRYALPRSIDDDLRDGCMVVCKVSRAAVAKRLGRNDRYMDFKADHVIETTGMPAQSIEAFLTILRSR
jgi:hypothetical protein